MNKSQAFELFEQMIEVAQAELLEFTLNTSIDIESKADKTLVTACDQTIDNALSQIARAEGLQVVSEEGEHVIDIARSGNYMTIDPIDGTLGYIEYVNYAIENGGVETFGKVDLGAKADFCLLLAVVENSTPKHAAVYNYITKEKILVSSDPVDLIRNMNVRGYDAENCFYMDQRMGGQLEQEVKSMPEVSSVTQAAFGLKSIYTVINPHQSATTIHRVQSAGLWDVMPSAVAARAFGAQIYDDLGEELKFNEYIVIPGKGATVIKGELFKFVAGSLKRIKNA